MSEPKNTPGNLFGTRYTDPGNPGTFIGKSWRAAIVAVMNVVCNTKYFIAVKDAAGNFVDKEADVRMGPLGAVVRFKLDTASSGGSVVKAATIISEQPDALTTDIGTVQKPPRLQFGSKPNQDAAIFPAYTGIIYVATLETGGLIDLNVDARVWVNTCDDAPSIRSLAAPA